MSLMNNTQPKWPGFTIVELLIVVVIVAILAAITIVSYNGIQNKAHNARAVSMIKNSISGIEQYKVLNGGYPSDGTYGATYCLGVGYPDKSCGYTTYSRSGCPYTSLSAVIKESDVINAAIYSAVKVTAPAIIQPTYTSTGEGYGCDIVYSTSGPTVKFSCGYTVTEEGGFTTVDYCAAGQLNQAYAINYLVKGSASPCVLSGKLDYSVESDVSGWGGCAVYGGNIKKAP